ncbi:ABC1 kinase family protein [Nannocystis radixulma]|uniref:AarF/ABC1/UbiB kinase family protein n=1 Tax=Nannocystis radixulma TaxID=2995305 RepID=A0ABT5BNZ8_9BACT|nr:AarF/ABC1/UbiB kinase family protein [Nannocystis radixulma]MDC0675890.1 AarF/ABC1/UbiB kinase family protein [Nannocystis radixulma]
MPKRRGHEKQTARERDISRIVRAALEEYRERRHAVTPTALGADGDPVIRPLPRRKRTALAPGAAPDMPIFRRERFEASALGTIRRLLVWLRLLTAFWLGGLADRLRRRDTVERRAERLLALIQRAGGSLVKLGQQLAVRVDRLPYEYCRELSKLTDSVRPFPTEQAIEAIERATGQPLHETFAVFDPTPIGAASIACVYQAVLSDGRKVAVKVRRPGVGELFLADCRAIRWLIFVMESLSLIRAGNLDNFISEFQDAIMEELDFRMEAYHQAIFRREARKAPFDEEFVTAGEVYTGLCGRDVLVVEFAAGMWMWEILAAVEQQEPIGLRRMRELNIDPAKVAERLIYVSMWGSLVSDIYHADPHPANIVVQRDSKLMFVDFGACGSVDRIKKDLSLDLLYHQLNKDVAGMVQAMLASMEPLPPIDVDQFAKEVELEIAKNQRKVWSKQAEWHEKTSASNWLALFALLQKYDLPSNLDTVRAFRAQMLYDTLAVRIHPEIDTHKVMRRFFRQIDRASLRQARKSLQRRLDRGLITGAEVRAIRGMTGMLSRGMQSLRRMIDTPTYNYAAKIGKAVFTVLELTRMLVILGTAAGLAFVADVIWRRETGRPIVPDEIFLEIVTSRPYLLFAAVIVVIRLRRIRYRLRDHETD